MEKLIFKDFELEFLKLFGIQFINGKFINSKTGNEFKHNSSYEKQDRFRTQLDYKLYCDGMEIEFYRNNDMIISDGFRVSVNIGDYKYWSIQDYFIDENRIRGRYVGITSYRYDEFKQEYPCMEHFKYDNDHFSEIQVEEDYMISNVTTTKLSNGTNVEYQDREIRSSLSSISEENLFQGSTCRYDEQIDNMDSSDEKIKLSVNNYKQSLIRNIENIYNDNTNAMSFYLNMVDYLSVVFESQLNKAFSPQKKINL